MIASFAAFTTASGVAPNAPTHDPVIESLVSVLITAAFAPNDPLIASLASELFTIARGLAPKAPSQEPVIDSLVNGFGMFVRPDASPTKEPDIVDPDMNPKDAVPSVEPDTRLPVIKSDPVNMCLSSGESPNAVFPSEKDVVI